MITSAIKQTKLYLSCTTIWRIRSGNYNLQFFSSPDHCHKWLDIKFTEIMLVYLHWWSVSVCFTPLHIRHRPESFEVNKATLSLKDTVGSWRDKLLLTFDHAIIHEFWFELWVLYLHSNMQHKLQSGLTTNCRVTHPRAMYKVIQYDEAQKYIRVA